MKGGYVFPDVRNDRLDIVVCGSIVAYVYMENNGIALFLNANQVNAAV